MYGIYMQTWLGYIDGKCYHIYIYHTWILWVINGKYFIWIFINDWNLWHNITYTFDTYHEIYHENYSVVGSYCRAMIYYIYIRIYICIMHGAMMFVHIFKTWSGLSRHFAPVLRGIELDVGLGGVVVVDLGTCRIPKKRVISWGSSPWKMVNNIGLLKNT